MAWREKKKKSQVFIQKIKTHLSTAPMSDLVNNFDPDLFVFYPSQCLMSANCVCGSRHRDDKDQMTKSRQL